MGVGQQRSDAREVVVDPTEVDLEVLLYHVIVQLADEVRAILLVANMEKGSQDDVNVIEVLDQLLEEPATDLLVIEDQVFGRSHQRLKIEGIIGMMQNHA